MTEEMSAIGGVQPLPLAERTALTADGRSVQLWINQPHPLADIGIVVVLMPGFANRMHQHSGLARQLVANGITVVRFDFLNHIGLSQGNVDRFTISDGLVSLKTALDHVYASFDAEQFVLISTSLSARIGLRQFAADKRLARFVAIAGVVHLRQTLRHVLEIDYWTFAESELPEMIPVEGQEVGSVAFYHDALDADWLSIDGAAAEIAAIDRPVQWFVGSADEWVSLGEVQASAKANLFDCVTVTELFQCGHDIGHNASIARSLTKEVTRFCCGRSGDVVEPSYSEILAVALDERRRQRKQGNTHGHD